jgi:hypothetical protein
MSEGTGMRSRHFHVASALWAARAGCALASLGLTLPAGLECDRISSSAG